MRDRFPANNNPHFKKNYLLDNPRFIKDLLSTTFDYWRSAWADAQPQLAEKIYPLCFVSMTRTIGHHRSA